MTTVVIKPVSDKGNKYRAAARDHESYGQTMGEALDALIADIDQNKAESTSIIIDDFSSDEFFTEHQRGRLEFLMQKLDRATNAGGEFTYEEKGELEHLIEAEIDGAVRRSRAIDDVIG